MDLRRQIVEKEEILEILEREDRQLSVNQDREAVAHFKGISIAHAKVHLNPGVQTQSFTIKNLRKTIPGRMKPCWMPFSKIFGNMIWAML